MKYSVILPLALCCAALSETVRLTPDQSISKAMISVHAGDTISLAPGIYKESIILKDKIILAGSSASATEIRGDGRGTTVVMHGGSTLTSLTVSGGQNGVQTQSGSAKIDHCVIRENRGSGLLAVKAFPEITHTVIAHNGGNGIQASTIGGGSLLLDSLTIAENGGYGIEISSSVPISVTNSLFYKNTLKAFRDPDGQLVASKNCIFPEQKEYSSNNRTGKPVFDPDKIKRSLYVQTSESPGRGTGASVK